MRSPAFEREGRGPILNPDLTARAQTVANGARGNILNPLLVEETRVVPVRAAASESATTPAPTTPATAASADSDLLFVAPLAGAARRRASSSRSSLGGALTALGIIALLGCGGLALAAVGGPAITAEARYGLKVAKGQLHRLVVVAKGSIGT